MTALSAQDDGTSAKIEEKEKQSLEYQVVEGLENWTYNYDISDFEDGTYNLVIRSRDKAGNVALDGPINIFIDSESDLPVSSISSPSRLMRVGGNFNIVGTAKDDDAVASVEYKINDGSWIPAEGTLFWTAFIDTTGWPDGSYTLYTRAHDVNGITGHEFSVEINLDKLKPVIAITSHNNGEILSGKKKISGTVSDSNGLSTLEYSLDGETWESLKLSGKDEHGVRDFSLDLDTRENEGGTSYVRFRAVDNTGSEGSNVFVYYADNEKPVITLISPQEDDVLNGHITVTGTVTDEVGIESLTCSYNGEDPEEIDLIPGNPYWNRTFDYAGSKGGALTFRAVDLSGNTEEIKFKVKTVLEEDKPVVEIIDFNDGGYLDFNEPVLKGILRDDDGVQSIVYSVDDGEALDREVSGPFVLDFSELDPGKHIVEIYGKDIYEIEGDPLKISFLVAENPPVLLPESYTRDKDNPPWANGAVFIQGKTAKISGRIEGGEGPLTLYYSLDGQEELEAKPSKGIFSISLPGKPEPGVYDFSMRIVDSLDRISEVLSRIYIVPAPGKDDPPFEPERLDSEDLIITDSRIRSSQPANLSPEVPLEGFLSGGALVSSVELDPPQSAFKSDFSENNFSIFPVAESEPVTFNIKVTDTSGREYPPVEIYAAYDFTAPILNLNDIQVPDKIENNRTVETLEKNSKGEESLVETIVTETELTEIVSSFIQDLMILKGSVEDISPLVKAEILFSGSSDSYGSPISIDLKEEDGASVLDKDFEFLTMEEGEHFFTLNIIDELGNETRKTVPFILDRTDPQIYVISPGSDEPVEGIITVSGTVDGFHGDGELYFSEDGVTFNTVELTSHNTFTHNIDLSAEQSDPSLFVFRAIDSGRNKVDFKPVFNVDLEADKPSAVIEVPSPGSTIRNDFSVTGLVFDDDAVASIHYAVDDGEFKEIEGNFYYNIPFTLDGLDDGEHKISLYAVDSGGFASDPVESSFLLSKSEPVSTIVDPSIDDYVKSTIVITGQSFDENGIDRVYISYDNGITYNEATIITEDPAVEMAENTGDLPAVSEPAEGEVHTPVDFGTVKTVTWEYSFDTRLPGDGTNSILVKSIDGAGTVGISSTIINIDNTYPEIKLDSPGESSSFAGKLILDGKVFDATGVKNVVAEINALENTDFETFTNVIDSDGVFREIYEISDFEPGWYNLNITVTDFADNSISETRNLRIIPDEESRSIDIFFPEEGKSFAGPFAIDGVVSGSSTNRVVLKVDDETFDTVEADENGLFSFPVEVNALTAGKHVLQVTNGDGETSIISRERNFDYSLQGPWVRVENLKSGEFVSGRPMVTGSAGFSGLSDEEKDKSKTVDFIEVSLDNGQTFTRAKGRENWEFRLETYDLPEGINQLIISAHFKDESFAVTKLFVNIDETAPVVDLFYPEENRTFNDNIALVGTASDENGLDSVEVLIRKGRKEQYEVPSFIQGLYLDFHALGSTYGEVGVGLSFFDDVVKLQVNGGLAPLNERFPGIQLGVKLIATILDIPFSYFFGYDWDFFSMSLAVGARFDYFTMSTDDYSFTDEGVVLGSVLVQFEFARFEIESLPLFNSYSLYTEFSLAFISSDIEAGIKPKLAFGARIGIF
ncbi:MAG: hypothetical protein JXR86_17265 [Spirochaetales bacterium]|nr:hypothetical protein [Spirochaetales bacterium]